MLGPYLVRRRVRRGGPAEGDGPSNPRSEAARLDEAVGLAQAIDLNVLAAIPVSLNALRPATYLGKGKVEEIAGLVRADSVGLVVMDCALTPVQQRNLEKAWGAKVIDRTGLILEIFGRRARTREGALQVELAHLSYQKSRLVRSWTHLERQRGGFGFLGGPGETQIEADRRLIQERMTRIERDLETVTQTRALHRASRRRVPYPIVALVGYTNAGKSTLFNRLTAAGVLAENMLFATLDPTSRAIKLPHGETAILSDTVGFISDLPTMLVAAFRATLEDVIEADVLLHVRDISHGDTDAEAADVQGVLRDLGIDRGRPPTHRRGLEQGRPVAGRGSRPPRRQHRPHAGGSPPGPGFGGERGGDRGAAQGHRAPHQRGAVHLPGHPRPGRRPGAQLALRAGGGARPAHRCGRQAARRGPHRAREGAASAHPLPFGEAHQLGVVPGGPTESGLWPAR